MCELRSRVDLKPLDGPRGTPISQQRGDHGGRRGPSDKS